MSARRDPGADCRIVAAGTQIAYTAAGAGEVILLVHGLGADRHTWRNLIPVLARTHRVIAPDLPGHGESGRPAGDYSIGAHAAALRDLLVGLGHTRVTVVGHSLGGGIAMQFAYLFPDRTERLVLIGTGGLGSELTLLLRATSLPGADMILAAVGSVPKAVTRRLLRLVSLLPNTFSTVDVAALSDGVTGLGHGGRRHAFRQTARTVIDWRGQTVSAVRQLRLLSDLPVLLIWGAKDKTIPARHHQVLLDELPNATATIIGDAGHYPHETAPAQVLDSLQAFLDRTVVASYHEPRWRQLLTGPDRAGRPSRGDERARARPLTATELVA